MLAVMVEPSPATVALKVLPLVMPLMFCDGVPALVTSTVTVTPALNRKPLGAFKMMVPRPMLPGLASAAMGLVKVVHVPPVLSAEIDRKSTRLNSSHGYISYAVFCLNKKQ